MHKRTGVVQSVPALGAVALSPWPLLTRTKRTMLIHSLQKVLRYSNTQGEVGIRHF